MKEGKIMLNTEDSMLFAEDFNLTQVSLIAPLAPLYADLTASLKEKGPLEPVPIKGFSSSELSGSSIIRVVIAAVIKFKVAGIFVVVVGVAVVVEVVVGVVVVVVVLEASIARSLLATSWSTFWSNSFDMWLFKSFLRKNI